MALTAFPILLFNSSTGSDTGASGAGPTTAVTGTCNAVTNSTTITFAGAPDLSGVAQDGSHVLFVDGLGYNRISTVDDTAKSVVVETAMTIGAGTAFAIGGKLASIDNTNARKLFAATSGPSTNFGASGQWTLRAEDDVALAISSAITLAFTAGSGYLIVESDSTTRRQCTQSANAVHFNCNTGNRIRFRYVQFRNSNATKNAVFDTTAGIVIDLLHSIVGAADGTDCPLNAMKWTSGGQPTFILRQSAILRTTSHGVTPFGNVRLLGSEISRCGGAGLSLTSGGGLVADHSIISHNSSYGIRYAGVSTDLRHCTVSHNGAAGVSLNSGAPAVFIVNNQITANAGWGLEISNNLSASSFIEYNNYGNASDSTANSSGTASLTSANPLSDTNTTEAPGYTDSSAGTRNFSISSAVKATGFPPSNETIGGGSSGTTSYVEIGAAQRQEPAGGGTRSVIVGG